jgi:hypothetical protein
MSEANECSHERNFCGAKGAGIEAVLRYFEVKRIKISKTGTEAVSFDSSCAGAASSQERSDLETRAIQANGPAFMSV